ncbi:MAG: putative activator of Hsp90 ATPase ue 1-like [Alphaproteobacteria bacterium]|nr:putative activator of Hsp90 ATPase ue 1-like [Alphaproteobacteria bacterium]
MKGEIVAESAVRFVRVLPGPIDKAWAFLTETSRLAEWYGEGRIEPREGGAVSLMGGHVRGVVTGWRPQEFLAYTWNVFAPGEAVSRFPVSYLEFTLAAEGKAVRLTLTHRPIPQPMQNQTAMGWHTMLDLVEAGLNDEFPKRADIFPTNAALYGVDMNNLR